MYARGQSAQLAPVLLRIIVNLVVKAGIRGAVLLGCSISMTHPTLLSAITFEVHQALLALPNPASQSAWDDYEADVLRWVVGDVAAGCGFVLLTLRADSRCVLGFV